MNQSDIELETLLRRFTPKQRAKLARLDRAPWSWFITDSAFFALVDEYNRDANRRYWETLSRVAAYDGPDYRIRLVGQRTWIRASERQYEQAAYTGVQRSIDVPDEPALLQITA